jgi:hypothetical protein
MSRYRPRIPFETKRGNNLAMFWKVTTDSADQALDAIVGQLKTRYHRKDNCELTEPVRHRSVNAADWYDARVSLRGRDLGRIAIKYCGVKTDTSTFEHVAAQDFMLIFQIGISSKDERDYFVNRS